MRFLKTLFWIIVAALVALFAVRNWRDVTIDLWGNLQADVKIPVLLTIVLLIGCLPTLLIYRTRLWRLQNRVSIAKRQPAPAIPDEVEQTR